MFVSIASYRDPELVRTVRDCLAKARHPERLRFGICWQHGHDEQLPDWFDGDQFRILDVDWRDSYGACWARAAIMDLWDGEEWFLQLDSHHRFVRDWDGALLDEAARSGSERPLLTSYAPPYTPGEPDPTDLTPLRIEFNSFTEDGIPMFRPGYIPDWEERTRPWRARFASAHLLLAPGRFALDVPYDPDLYFEGEEITLALRAFTHGYDLFEPSRLIVWHEYSRSYRRKHWDDHGGELFPAWYERDRWSRKKICRLFADPFVGRFGLGTERTLAEYEAYCGLSFRHRKIQEYTRLNLEPPNPPADPDWARRVQDRRVELSVNPTRLPPGWFKEAAFWYVGVHDRDGRELNRRWLRRDELEHVLNRSQRRISLVREFESQAAPASWTVMPHSASRGWLEPVTNTLNEESRTPNDHPVVLVTGDGGNSPASRGVRPNGRARQGWADARARIFVAIASYRDPDLVPTVQDCVAKARYPDRLRFGICWQHAPDEQLPDWFDGDRFRVLDVDWKESHGQSWARAAVADQWDGEEWYLQLDSHHRFVDDWDQRLLEQAVATGSARPIVSAPGVNLSAGSPASFGDTPFVMKCEGFASDALPALALGMFPEQNSRGGPIRARFVCSHFLLAPSSFIAEVPHDPELYRSEEIVLSIRAFTHGYDLFHPSEVLMSHAYTYEHQTAWWDDHSGHQLESSSRKKVACFLAKPFVGRLGLGRERTFAEYEAYAGLSFRDRKVQDYTRFDLEPPNPPADPGWPKHVRHRRVEISVDVGQLPEGSLEDPTFWYVGVHDRERRELHRRDLDPAEIESLLGQNEPITLLSEFEAQADPATWTVIPYSKSAGWLQSLTEPVASNGSVRGDARRPARARTLSWESSGDQLHRPRR